MPLRPIFPTPRIFRHKIDGVEHPSGRRGRQIWMLSRAHCRYRVFSLIDDRSPARRLAALDLAIAQWSPYQDTGRLVQAAQGRAGVWIWDNAAVTDAIIAAGKRPQRMNVLPEAALQPRGDEGLRLIAGLDGYEGQWWQEGLLLGSRWWREPPSVHEWLQFRRACGVPPDETIDRSESIETLSELTTPWITSAAWWRRVGPPDLTRAYQALGAAFLILTGIFLGESASDRATLTDIRRLVAEASTTAEERGADRAAARSGVEAIRNLAALDPFPGQLELFEIASKVVPPNGARITDWTYRSGELEFTLTSPTPLDAVATVKAFDSRGGFRDVTLTRSDGDRSLRVKLKVLPR